MVWGVDGTDELQGKRERSSVFFGKREVFVVLGGERRVLAGFLVRVWQQRKGTIESFWLIA